MWFPSAMCKDDNLATYIALSSENIIFQHPDWFFWKIYFQRTVRSRMRADQSREQINDGLPAPPTTNPVNAAHTLHIFSGERLRHWNTTGKDALKISKFFRSLFASSRQRIEIFKKVWPPVQCHWQRPFRVRVNTYSAWYILCHVLQVGWVIGKMEWHVYIWIHSIRHCHLRC